MRSLHKSFILLLMALLALVAAPFVAASTHPVHAEHAIVVSVHDLASRAGVEIMQAGGNAVDAAVATGFALAVVHPPAGNIGGGGFMLIRMADGNAHFLDYREKAPAAATRDMYLDAQGNVIPGASEIGYKSIGVPGSVAGMVYAEQKYGQAHAQAGYGSGHPAGTRGLRADVGRGRAIFTTIIWPSSPNRGACFSAMATTTSREKFFANPIWLAPWNASRPSRTIFITALWRANWPQPCKKAAA